MDSRTVAGLLGTIVVTVVAALGLYGFTNGYLIESPGDPDLFAPSIGVLAVAVAFVLALSAVGARSSRWLENPYW
ncbi:hypothetical protein ACFQGT_00725 [Natrialbaceae archaeon GCM10025810]|uniref:hypothetical protein n=1 Tax=Halovalidus salilacus TaxID=3075124 RepID=UPI003621E39C